MLSGSPISGAPISAAAETVVSQGGVNMIEIFRQKNVASIIVFPIITVATGMPTSAVSTPDSERDAWSDGVAPDGFADCTNEATEIGTTGYYYLSLTQTEMNADYIIIQIKNATAGTATQTVLINTTNAPAVWTTALTEAYAADGAAFTGAQAMYEICQLLEERTLSGTTMTVKKRDGSTTAFTLTINSATAPTTQTRST